MRAMTLPLPQAPHRARARLLGACLLTLLSGPSARGSEPIPPPPATVSLMDAALVEGGVLVTYGKDFPECPAVFTSGWVAVGGQGLLCEAGEEVEALVPPSLLPVVEGETLWLCHPDNYLLCSQPLVVEDRRPQPLLRLDAATVNPQELRLVYSKDVEGCALLVDPAGLIVAPTDVVCGVGEGLAVAIPLELTQVYPGLTLALCAPEGAPCGEGTLVEVAEAVEGCEGEGSLYPAAVVGNLLLLLSIPALRRRRGGGGRRRG